jgi:outer membrane assembly lipoprotein YfiO
MPTIKTPSRKLPSLPQSGSSACIRSIPNVDYAYYLKGLTSFDQDVGLLARFLPLDMTKRDPGAARDSYNEFAQLTSRFPNSRYAPDAKQRMIYLRNLLAAYEIHVAHYYLTRQAYVASPPTVAVTWLRTSRKPLRSLTAWR